MKNTLRFVAVLMAGLCFTLSFASAQTFADPMMDEPVIGMATAPALSIPSLAKPADVNAVTHQWSSGAPMPLGKKYHTIASFNGDVYIFGGLRTDPTSGAGYFDSTAYKYNVASKTWTKIKDFPQMRFINGLAQTVNGKIYIFGGLENSGNSYKTILKVWEYDPAADTYTPKANMKFAQGFACSGVLDGKIYVISGNGTTTSQYLNLVQVYDPATDSWGTATNYPKPARYISCATVGNAMIASGGYNNNNPNVYYNADTYKGELDNGTLKWTKVADYPIGPTILMSSVGVNGKGYFFGGRPSIDGNAPATPRSFCYDPATDKWETFEIKPTGMQYQIQAGTDGNVVVMAGGEVGRAGANGYFATDATEILDPAINPFPLAAMSTDKVDLWVKKGTTRTAKFYLYNSGPATYTYTVNIDPSAPWTTVSSMSGSVTGYTRVPLTVTFDGGTAAVGEHVGSFTVQTSDPENGSMFMNLIMHVQDEDVDADPVLLLDHFTGTWCVWCPYGADSIAALQTTYGKKLEVASYHNRDAMSTSIGDLFTQTLQVPGFPTAAINRTLFDDQSAIAISRPAWGNKVNLLLSEYRSPVTITVSNKTYNPGTKAMSLKVKVFFHQTVTGNINLSMIQTESGFNYTQMFTPNGSTTQPLSPYTHKNVVRLMHPDELGTPLTGNSFTTQSFIEQEVNFISDDSAAENSRLIFVLYRMNGTTIGPVLQAYGEKLLDGISAIDNTLPVASDFALRAAYPNPFNPSTTVSFDVPRSSHVRLVVTDVLGREVRTLADGTHESGVHTVRFDATGLQSGTYFLTMQAGSFSQTRTLTLMK